MKPADTWSDRRRLALQAALIALLGPGALPARADDGPWQALNESQRTVLAPFRAEWSRWPLQEREIWIRLADQVPRLDTEQRGHALARIREWAALSPDERSVARRNFQLARTLGRDDRIRQWERYNSMTPEQRSILRAFPLLGGDSQDSRLPGRASQPLGLVPSRR
ncbi:MAG: DUF3106 domain-containing protein [Burkholderiaceae bacterium]